MPPQAFDRTEMEAIALGLAEVGSMGDPALARSARSALAKVVATVPDDREQQLIHAISQIYRPNARMHVGTEIEVLREACWQEEALEIGYTDKSGEVTQRSILPLCFMYTDRKLIILAWCNLRCDYRMFDITRIVQPNATGRSFRPRRVAMLRDYLAKLKAGQTQNE